MKEVDRHDMAHRITRKAVSVGSGSTDHESFLESSLYLIVVFSCRHEERSARNISWVSKGESNRLICLIGDKLNAKLHLVESWGVRRCSTKIHSRLESDIVHNLSDFERRLLSGVPNRVVHSFDGV